MTGPLNSLHFALGPAVAVVVALALALVSRWAFAPSRQQRRERERAWAHRDFGLLVPVATVGRRGDAEELCRLLGGHGIRATSTEAPPGPVRVSARGDVERPGGGGHHVLVFERDAGRARRLVSTGR